MRNNNCTLLNYSVKFNHITTHGQRKVLLMKKHITFKILLPLTIIFLLTLIVNLTTTSALQDVRATLQTMSESAGSMSSEEVAQTANDTVDTISTTLSTNGLVSSAQLIMVIVSIFIAYLCVTKPLKVIIGQLEKLTDKLENNQGDLGERIYTKKTDEIGKMVLGINLYMEKLQTIMKKIKSHSGSLDESSCNISAKVSDSNNDMNIVTQQADELRDEVQMFVNSLNEIISYMATLNTDSKSMSDAVVAGKEYSIGIRGRADHVRTLADNSKEESSKITMMLRKDLEDSVENSRSVDAIAQLTEEILSISSKTNLLALNASIEAARAGEAGKGFAVVADEIRELADNSRDTANRIQEISTIVMTSVKSLADASEKLLDFISNNVSEDYDEFVAAAEEYLKDADHVEEMMNEFETKSTFFTEATDEMDTKLKSVSQEALHENNNIKTLVETIDTLADNMTQIMDYTSVNDNVSDSLKSEISKFKAI